MANRVDARKATIEIQRRPRTKTASGIRKTTVGANPQDGQTLNAADLPKEIRNAYAPDQFDPDSSILACNFPPSVTINQAGNYFRWIGPIVRIERAESKNLESNFVVVFATSEHAEICNQSELYWDNEGTRIYTRMVDKKPPGWSFSSWFGWDSGQQEAQANPAPVQRTDYNATTTGGQSNQGRILFWTEAESSVIRHAAKEVAAWFASLRESTGAAFSAAGQTVSNGFSSVVS